MLLYDIFGLDVVVYIVNYVFLCVVVCLYVVLVMMVVCLKDTSTVKFVVCYGGRGVGSLDFVVICLVCEFLLLGVKLVSYEDMLEIGLWNLLFVILVVLDDLVMICYISGTTGASKGVMLMY